ncbi:MAG: hypothetical protein VX738_02475 [Planctomycetota bacterium]|nr:hypothetical protein [Planctomycetota bacterium]
MVDSRFIKSISGRFDVEIDRHPNPMRRLRWRISCISAVLTIVIVLIGYATQGDAVFQSRPVTTSHAMLANRCDLCHQNSFQLPRRLLGHPSGNFIAGCQNCHVQHMQDHHPVAESKTPVSDCSSCHSEHRGKQSLTDVSDSQCVRCHQDLRGVAEHGTSSFINSVESIQSHPELAILRHWASNPPGNDHQVHHVVALRADGQMMDKGHLQFNHAVHMNPDGILIPPDHPDYLSADSQPTRTNLQCATCHEPDATGTRMKPIAFEQHCASCHQLSYSRLLQETPNASNQPLPHESPEIIRGVLRDRLTAYLQKQTPADAIIPNRNPAKPVQSAVDGDHWKWVENQREKMEALLFAGGKTAGNGDMQNGCALCHSFQKHDHADQPVQWKIEPTDVPEQWLAHARFPHNRHDLIHCTDCHSTSDKDGKRIDAANLSNLSQHILIPSMRVCQSCHKDDQREPNAVARGRCVDCHDYHTGHGATDSPRTIQSILKQHLQQD